jgi:hypothetical protein
VDPKSPAEWMALGEQHENRRAFLPPTVSQTVTHIFMLELRQNTH